MKILLSGPPGCGKGTQAELLVAKCGIAHYSTGDVFRDHIRRGTAIGIRAREYVQSGRLVPDEIVLEIARDFIVANRSRDILFDGFPRTRPQAEGLDQILSELGETLNLAIFIDLSAEEIIRRLTSRRTCRNCGAIFNLDFKPPQQSGICDICRGELYQRADDQEATIRERLSVYEQETGALKEYYRAQGKLQLLDGSVGKENLHKLIITTLNQYKPAGCTPRM